MDCVFCSSLERNPPEAWWRERNDQEIEGPNGWSGIAKSGRDLGKRPGLAPNQVHPLLIPCIVQQVSNTPRHIVSN